MDPDVWENSNHNIATGHFITVQWRVQDFPFGGWGGWVPTRCGEGGADLRQG